MFYWSSFSAYFSFVFSWPDINFEMTILASIRQHAIATTPKTTKKFLLCETWHSLIFVLTVGLQRPLPRYVNRMDYINRLRLSETKRINVNWPRVCILCEPAQMKGLLLTNTSLSNLFGLQNADYENPHLTCRHNLQLYVFPSIRFHSAIV